MEIMRRNRVVMSIMVIMTPALAIVIILIMFIMILVTVGGTQLDKTFLAKYAITVLKFSSFPFSALS